MVSYTPRPAQRAGSTRVIVVHQISRRFGSTDAVRDLSFEVPPDCPCGFLGPNGAGKTTTLRIIVGALSADAGHVRICGRDVSREGPAARRLVGYLPERCPLPADLTVREWLSHRCGLWGMPRRDAADSIREVIGLCSLEPFRRRLCGALSRGMAQRVGLAAALVTRPSVLVLDEPGAGMDPAQAHSFRQLVRSLACGRTVLFSSHNLAEVDAVCDRVIMIARGRLVAAGTMDDLRRRGAGRERWRIECDRIELSALSAIAGVHSVRAEPAGEGWFLVSMEIDHASSGPARVAVARAIAAGGGTLRLMSRIDEPLEQVFSRVATESPA